MVLARVHSEASAGPDPTPPGRWGGRQATRRRPTEGRGHVTTSGRLCAGPETGRLRGRWLQLVNRGQGARMGRGAAGASRESRGTMAGDETATDARRRHPALRLFAPRPTPYDPLAWRDLPWPEQLRLSCRTWVLDGFNVWCSWELGGSGAGERIGP